MPYFVPRTNVFVSVEELRANAGTLSTRETVVFNEAGRFFWRLDGPIIGEQLAFLSDVTLVDFGAAGGIIQNETLLGPLTLYQVFESSPGNLGLATNSSSSSQFDEVLSGLYSSFLNNSTFERLLVEPGQATQGWLPEFYLSAEADTGVFDQVYGPFGLDAPNDGRALIVRGTVGGQRDAAWGNWLEVLNFTGGSQPAPPTEPTVGQYNSLDPSQPDFVPPDALLPLPDPINPYEYQSGPVQYVTDALGNTVFTEERSQAFDRVSVQYQIDLKAGLQSYLIKKATIASLSLAFPGAGWVGTLSTTWDVYSATKPLITVGFQAFLHDVGISEATPSEAQINRAFAESFANVAGQLTGLSGGVVGGAAVSTAGAILFTETNSYKYSFFEQQSLTVLGAQIVGESLRDLAIGTAFSDTISGLGGNDRLLGMDGDDVILGGIGNDRLFGAEGSDVLDGGSGFDIAVFEGSVSSYAISGLSGTQTVADPSGVDELTNIERLEFADGFVNLALSPESLTNGIIPVLSFDQQLQLIYVGYFERAADPVGFAFWGAQNAVAQDAGQGAEEALSNIANSFRPQPETLALYPALGATNPSFTSPQSLAQLGDFLDAVYLNLFNRLPDADGKAFWTGQILSGNVGFGAAILAIANGATGSDATIVFNKVDVALDFTGSTAALTGSIDGGYLSVAAQVLDEIDETYASVADGLSETASFIAGQVTPVVGLDMLTLS